VPFVLRSQRRLVGIFASRGPRRVNPIGLSLIQIVEVAAASVTFAGVDVVDGTPVIDIKPYVTRFDRPPGDPRCGWFDQVSIDERATPARLVSGP
jgi:tRNA (Thr-GGU) A37 N-methylase